MQFSLRLALLLLLLFMTALLTAGCAHIPVATMYKLWTFDFAHADPAAIRAAIRVPATLMPRPGGAKLQLTRSGQGGSQPVETFILQEVTDQRELKELSAFARAGYPITAYKLDDSGLARLRALQAQINADRASGDKNASGSLGVGIDACARQALPPGALLTSTYLKLDLKSGYMPVVEDIDLRKEIASEDLAKHIPRCADLSRSEAAARR